MPGPLSGKYGFVNGSDAVFNWSINDNQAPAVAVDSSTGNGTDRVAGINSWDGTFSQNNPEPSALAGDIFSFTGFTAPDDGQPNGTGTVYSGQALCSQNVITWDYAGGAVLSAVQTFLGHLGLTISQANHADASISNPFSICGTKIEHSTDGTAWTELTNVSNAALTLSCATNDYVNSSTNCDTGRAAGPKDWTAAIVLDETSRAAPVPDKGTSLQWRFWIDDTRFWRLKWGLVRDFTGIVVDRITGAIIQQTMNVDMKASDGSALGAVAAPSGAFWFGTTFTPTAAVQE